MSCRYCGYNYGSHADNCPQVLDGTAQLLATTLWRAGYDDGRSGHMATLTEPHYVMGFTRGDAAADEAANSEPWSSYP